MRDAVIETHDLTKRFEETAVDRVSLSVPKGSVYALLGRNGAGKTTTIHMVLGLLENSGGESRVFDEDSSRLAPGTKRRISFVDEGASLYRWMRISEIIGYTAAFYRDWAAKECDRMVEMFELDRNAKIGALSPGERAKLSLVLAVSSRPELLVVDDLSGRLDVIARRQCIESVIRVIQEEGRTVLFSSHILTEVERIADRIAIIDKGVLKVDLPIDELKAAVKKVVLEFDGPAPRLKPADNLLREQADGSTLLATVRCADGDPVGGLRGYGARRISVHDLTLEEIFIELVDTGKETHNVL